MISLFFAVDDTSGSINHSKHIGEEDVRNSSNANNQTTDKSTSNLKWVSPKPFESESTSNKISLILKWIFGPKSHEKYVSGEKIANITTILQRLKFNSYLRLLEIDMNIMKEHMTESSWTLFEDFKEKRKDDKWKCPQCFSLFTENAEKYKCGRCLLWFHTKCSQPRTSQKDGVSLCTSCFFSL